MTDLDLTSAAVDRVGVYLRERIGLRSEGTLRGRLRRSVVDEAAVHGDSLGAYAERLCLGGESLDHLVNRLTVQESGFFRHPEHFDVLATSVLPGLEPPVTIWSAACGNGQEAYSLAMLLEERAIAGSVVASDLSTAALARTANASYSAHEISGISPQRRQRHLITDGRGSRVGPRVRGRVTSFQQNLVDELPGHVGAAQVVFCRNVLIYLSPEHASAFLERLASALRPGAYLFLGAAESLWQVTDRFEAVRLGDTFVYRRREPAAPATAATLATSPANERARRSNGLAVVRRPKSPRRIPRLVAPPSDAEPDPTAALADSGRLALADGDHEAAIVIFRKWAYLAPDNPMAPFHLGLALEAAGHRASAQRAFAMARAALAEAGSAPVEHVLEGFAREELLKLLDAKQGAPR